MSCPPGPFDRAAGAIAALSLCTLLSLPARADDALGTVIVTASRFSETDPQVPANVSVISREDIASTPTGNLVDLLSTRAGIDPRSLYGSLGADASVDLRGFGENGYLRTLVLVDGRRLDSLDFTAANWRAIPLASIERIEIVRGSGAVLYGDQAAAGVINIITDRGRRSESSVTATAGSFGYGQLAADYSHRGESLRGSFNVEHVESDEYRRNNAHRATTAAGRLAHDIADGEVFAEAGASDMHYGLPGVVTASQWISDPRASETTDSWFERESYYLRPGFRLQVAPKLEAAAELSLDESHNRSWISNWFSYRDIRVHSTAFTPRLRWAHGLGELASTTVAGIDWSDARLDQDRYGTPGGAKLDAVSLHRRGSAVYVHNTTQAAAGLALTLGVRQQRYDSDATDAAAGANSTGAQSKTATEAGLVWQATPAWKLFLKQSTTFRYPVLDELTTFAGLASPAPRPESGRGTDLGAEWRAGGHSVQVTFYDLKMTDEIAWNNATFQNENLQKTLHRGVEIDSRWQLAKDWRLNLSWNGKEARYREGSNAGKTIPLVPTRRWTAMLAWDGGAWGDHALVANHVGSRYFGGDDANALASLPAFTSVDWQSKWALAQWELGLRVANLTNRKYATLGYDYGFGASYYPANPRSAYLTARYRF